MTQKRASRPLKGKKISPLKRHGKNWVVAVDPFAGFDLGPLRELVVPLAEKYDADIYAAYVLAPASLNWTGEFSGPWVKRYRPIAQRRMDELFPVSLIRPTVLPCHQSGIRASVKALLSFATKIKAQCLVLSTHARTGIERLALGSFAETVLLAAKIPVLVINPERSVPTEIRRILVSTDLSRRSDKYVLSVAEYAKAIGAEIILYYKQPDPLDPIVQQGVYSMGGAWISVQNYIDKEVQLKDRHLEKLEAVLRKRGVQVSHVLDSSPEDLVEGIHRAAQAHTADLVTVLTGGDAWSANLLGSVARGLVRTSEIPVLVQR